MTRWWGYPRGLVTRVVDLDEICTLRIQPTGLDVTDDEHAVYIYGHGFADVIPFATLDEATSFVDLVTGELP